MTSARDLTRRYESTEGLASLLTAAIVSIKRESLGLDEPKEQASAAREYLATLIRRLVTAPDLPGVDAVKAAGSETIMDAISATDDGMSQPRLLKIADHLSTDTPLEPTDLAELDVLTRALNAAAASAYSQVVRG